MNSLTSVWMILVLIPVMLGFFVDYSSGLVQDYFKIQLKSCNQLQNDLTEYQNKLKDKPIQQAGFTKADEEIVLIAKRDTPSVFRGSFSQIAVQNRIQLMNQVAGDPIKPCALGSRWTVTPFTVEFVADSASTARFINELMRRHSLVRLTSLRAVSSTERNGNLAWNARFEIAHF